MARMSIDDKFLRDPRVARLALGFGWSKFEIRGRLLEVYAVCYDRESAVLSPDDVDPAADCPGLAKAMITAGLATTRGPNVRVSGAEERIEYLKQKRESGRTGGVNSGLSRRESPKHPAKHPAKHPSGNGEALRNPPDPVPDSVPDPVPDDLPDQRKRRARGKRGADVSPDEFRIAQAVLTRLGSKTGVRYSGAEEHVRLIACRLRDGCTEAQLRAVVAYCEDEWLEKPEMRKYLRPETLFGPQTIARYLDPACARYADQIAQHTPQLTLVPGGVR